MENANHTNIAKRKARNSKSVAVAVIVVVDNQFQIITYRE